MTNDERITAEAEIRKCARNWKGQSKSAFLLEQAVKVIDDLKASRNAAREANTELGNEVAECHEVIQKLREKNMELKKAISFVQFDAKNIVEAGIYLRNMKQLKNE